MASHRKPRTRTTRAHSPAVGVTTAAIASVSLLSAQNADAAPSRTAPDAVPSSPDAKPTAEEVQRKVDALYRQAGTGTRQYERQYDSPKEAAPRRRLTVDKLFDGAGKRAQPLNETRRTLGTYTAGEPRPGAVAQATGLIVAADPQAYAEQTQQMPEVQRTQQMPEVQDVHQIQHTQQVQDVQQVQQFQGMPEVQRTQQTQEVRQTPQVPRPLLPRPDHEPHRTALSDPPAEHGQQALAGHGTRHSSAEAAEAVEAVEAAEAVEAKERTAEAAGGVDALTASQAVLRASKQDVQRKLREARDLLSSVTVEELTRRAELDHRREAQARLRAEARVREEAEAARARQDRLRREQSQDREQQPETSTGRGSWTASATAAATGYGTSAGAGTGSRSAKADKVLAFARAQVGKPYVWGATGPSSYDCSGLTQAAWRAAGVELPRTTWGQIEFGTPVDMEALRPGDLVFFYDDISHVGIYEGEGRMIHAPKPGANVREESVYCMPIHGSVRPA
ncbi:C40 family peptidase [Streptomyces sp. SP18CS02]|uniref:C40 family peptidase n=1 Tax=Streptomyces sp. SP18CS02 TaxID=3002531 RepID=UPI003FCD7CCF